MNLGKETVKIKPKFKATIKLELDLIEIESLIISAIEGGSNYWYRIENSTRGDYLKTAMGKSGLIISDYIGNDGDEKTMRKGRLNNKSIHKALQLMASKHPRHFGDLLSDNADSTTADVFLQLAVLGEVIYG